MNSLISLLILFAIILAVMHGFDSVFGIKAGNNYRIFLLLLLLFLLFFGVTGNISSFLALFLFLSILYLLSRVLLRGYIKVLKND